MAMPRAKDIKKLPISHSKETDDDVLADGQCISANERTNSQLYDYRALRNIGRQLGSG